MTPGDDFETGSWEFSTSSASSGVPDGMRLVVLAVCEVCCGAALVAGEGGSPSLLPNARYVPI